jgi:type II secretory pathway pseudopilin PulG
MDRGAFEGFTLVETLFALLVLTFGVLAAGQLIYVGMSSASLARSKGSATIAAQDKLESLADLFRRDPEAADLSFGPHGPEQATLLNPLNGQALNRFGVEWTVTRVPDPRPGKLLGAVQVAVKVTPVNQGTASNRRISLNKVVHVTALFSARVM